MCVPYLVELDTGDDVIAPRDDDNAIRALANDVKPIEISDDVDMKSREGCVVEIVGLKSQPKLNGQRARTLEWNEETQRMGVQLDDTKVAVKMANLKFLDEEEAAAPSAAKASANVGGAFEPSLAFAGARPGFVFKRGIRGLGYYQDDNVDAARQAESLVAPLKDKLRGEKKKPPAPPPAPPPAAMSEQASSRHTAMKEKLREKKSPPPPPAIATRQAATARLNADDAKLGDGPPDATAAVPLLPSRELTERAYKSYRALVEMLPASVTEAGPKDGFDLELLLLLLGIKPSVLIAHNSSPNFVKAVVESVLEPWMAGVPCTSSSSSAGPPPPPPELQTALVLRQITHPCTPFTAPSGPCCFQHAWVLYASQHPQRVYVEAAFFPPDTLKFVPNRDPVLYSLIGRALGYPTCTAGAGNCDLNYVSLANDGPLGGLPSHMAEVAEDATLFEYMVEAPGEIPGAVRHFLASRKACARLIPIGLAMGGRYIRVEDIEALEGKSDDDVIAAFDAFAMQINQMNSEEGEEEGVHV